MTDATLRNRTTVIGPARNVGSPVPLDPAPYDGAIAYDGQRMLWSDGTKWSPFASIEQVQTTLKTPIQITVGAGGDFPTLGAAMQEAANYAPGLPSTMLPTPLVTISILSGTVLAEQVRVFFRDMGYVVIVSEDPVVNVDITNFVFSEGADYSGLPPVNPPATFNAGIFLNFEGGVAPRVLTKFQAINENVNGLNVIIGCQIRLGTYMQLGLLDRTLPQVASSDLWPHEYGFIGNWTWALNCGGSSGIIASQCEFTAKTICVGFAGGNNGNFVRCKARRSSGSFPTRGLYLVSGLVGLNSCDFRVIDGVESDTDVLFVGAATLSYTGPNIAVPSMTPTLGRMGNTFNFESDGFRTWWTNEPSTPSYAANIRQKGILWPDQFTVATLPAAVEAAGQIVYCTNGDNGNPCIAVSDGTDWKIVPLGATVS